MQITVSHGNLLHVLVYYSVSKQHCFFIIKISFVSSHIILKAYFEQVAFDIMLV